MALELSPTEIAALIAASNVVASRPQPDRRFPSSVSREAQVVNSAKKILQAWEDWKPQAASATQDEEPPTA